MEPPSLSTSDKSWTVLLTLSSSSFTIMKNRIVYCIPNSTFSISSYAWNASIQVVSLVSYTKRFYPFVTPLRPIFSCFVLGKYLLLFPFLLLLFVGVVYPSSCICKLSFVCVWFSLWRMV